MITLSQFTFAYNYDESNTCTYLHSNFQVPFTLWKIWNFDSKIENSRTINSTQHFCTKLEYFQDKTQTKVQKQIMEFWTQNSILPQCAFIAKVWITLHGWVGFYWVVKPRHISTWTVDMNRAYFPSHLIPIDDPGLWFKSSPSMFAQKTFTTSGLQNKSWGFLHTSKLFDDSKL